MTVNALTGKQRRRDRRAAWARIPRRLRPTWEVFNTREQWLADQGAPA